MIQFINREEELKFLESAYKSKKPEFIVMFGRRRIGKTELVTEFCKGKPHIYYLCSEESQKENIDLLKEKMSIFLSKPFFKELELDSIFKVFSRFTEFLDNRKKTIIAIDEFPYLINLNKGIISTFQKIWDELFSKRNVVLILTGSSVSMMESEVLGRKSPLYGRRTAQWKLEEFKLPFLKKFFPNYGTEELLKLYAVIGAVPLYLSKFEKTKSLEENIKEEMLTKGRFLYDEVKFLLKEEFREQKTYMLILKKLAQGYNNLGKLCSATGMDKANLSKYLYVLEETRIIRHILPLGKKRGGIYIIKDPLFSFWFRMVYPYRMETETGNTRYVIQRIQKNFSAYMGKLFESICEKLIREKYVKTPFPSFELKKWWYKDKEIDLIALNEQTMEIMFCECKWQDRVDAKRLLKELKEKAGHVQWNNEKRKESFAVFAKSFKKKFKEKNVYLYDLRDLEKAFKK